MPVGRDVTGRGAAVAIRGIGTPSGLLVAVCPGELHQLTTRNAIGRGNIVTMRAGPDPSSMSRCVGRPVTDATRDDPVEDSLRPGPGVATPGGSTLR